MSAANLPSSGNTGVNSSRALLLAALLCCLLFPSAAGAAPAGGGAMPALYGIPAPLSLFASGKLPPADPAAILEAMLGIPYRDDGALNDQGEFTQFARQDRRFDTPGLNCSGFVSAASRYLLQRNFTLDEVKRDRLGDSGPGSPYGEDWDFGWDLIMNISENFSRSLLLPGGKVADPAAGNGFAPRGYDIQDPATWNELPGRLLPGYLYLVSFNVHSRRKGYDLQHYHVGLIHVNAKGQALFYHNTGKGAVVNRRDLKSPSGQASFRKAYTNVGDKRKMIVIIAVKMPL